MIKRNSFIRLACLLSILFTFNGCTRATISAHQIFVQLSSEPVSLDPHLAEDGISLKILANTMDGLVGYDGAGRLQKRLAESWEISPDGKQYEFVLRPDALWSDGVPVTAGQFVASFKRALDPKTGSHLASMLYSIRGARAILAGKAPMETLGVSERMGKLVIELEHPTSYFIQVLTLPVAVPLRPELLIGQGGKWQGEGPSTGPYRVVKHEVDRYLRLEPNPAYRPSTAHAIPVTFQIVQDESTASSLYETGKLDILTKIPSLDLERFKKMGRIHTDPFYATFYLGFNLRKPPFNDRDVRRAVSGSIRRQEIVAALGSEELAASSWVPVGIEGYIPFHDPSPKTKGSMDLVRSRFKGFPQNSVIAAFDSSGRNSMILEKVQADLLRNLGLKLELSQMDWKSYIKNIRADTPQMYRLGWLAPFNDPVSHMQAFVTGGAANYSGWSNQQYDKWVAEIAKLPPGKDRVERLRQAQDLLVEDEAVVVPIYHYVQTHAVSARVKGFRVNAFGVIRYEELSF